MKTHTYIVLGTLLPLLAQAQVTVTSDMAFTQYPLLGPIPVTVHIENNTPAPLLIGGPKGCPLSFHVTRQHYHVLPVVEYPMAHTAVEIPPGETFTREFDLRRCVDLRETGQYTAAARLDWAGKTLPSNKHFVTVRPGVEQVHLDVMSSGVSPSLRRFRIMLLERDKHRYAFLRVDDEDRGLCYGVYDLGYTTSMRPAVLQVDDHRNVHILLQSGPQLFTHFQFSPEGRYIAQKEHQGTGFAELVSDEDGGLKVAGLRDSGGDVMGPGGRAFSGADLMKTPR